MHSACWKTCMWAITMSTSDLGAEDLRAPAAPLDAAAIARLANEFFAALPQNPADPARLPRPPSTKPRRPRPAPRGPWRHRLILSHPPLRPRARRDSLRRIPGLFQSME